MARTKTLRKKTIALIVLMVFFGSIGDVLLSKGMKQIGAVDVWSAPALQAIFLKTFTSGTIWLGIGFLLLFLMCDLLVLSWADYSFVSPASATGYALVPLLGHLLLGETVTAGRWAGVALICVGVAVVGVTSPRTTAVTSASASQVTQEGSV